MKKALIISYYFPPYNGVPGWRPYSWFSHFHKSNIHPTVITRHWNGNENTWSDSIKESETPLITNEREHGTVLHLPYQHSRLKKFSDTALFKIPGLSKIYYLFLMLLGRLSVEIDAYYSFKKFLVTYLKDHTFDIVIVSAPPQNLVRLGYFIKKKYNIPFAVDYRDIWDNDELKENYKPGFNRKIRTIITKIYMRKWLKEAEFIITVSASLAKRIRSITQKEVQEITNGFEEELFNHQDVTPSKTIFTISIIGTIYPQQDISIIIDGLNKFITAAGPAKVKLNFIGIEAIDKISQEIKSKLGKECLYTTQRLSREAAIEYTLTSHVLLYAGWKNYQGIYSGKIFDYLGARRNILIAPGDNDVIDSIVTKSNAGKIANTVDEFYSILMNWFHEWEASGVLSYKGKQEVINYYTRENQTKIFAAYILTALK
jgi:hypothetical protein